MNRLCTAKGIWLEGGFARGEFWLVVIIKVKVSSQAAAETHCWLQSHNVSLSLLGRPHHLGSNQPTLLLLLLVQCCCCCCAALVAKLLLRTFSAHSALGLETRPTEMECFLMTGSGTEGRVATWWWRQSCWCRGGNELAGSAGAAHMVQKVHRPAKRDPDNREKTCCNLPFHGHLFLTTCSYEGEVDS